MVILGVSCFYHDAAAALLRDGDLVAAAEQERFSRKKHDFRFPNEAIDFCLKQGGITAADLDFVVFYEKPLLKFERVLLSTLSSFPRSWRAFREAMITWFSEKLWVKNLLCEYLDLPAAKILFVEHHLAHAASAFFSSPFDEAAIVTVDGVGEWTTTAMGWGRAAWAEGERNEINLIKEQRFPHSMGLLYSAFTAFLGFKVNNGEYKVMGMAPYGQPRYVDRVRQLVQVQDDGSFRLNMDYFSFHHSIDKTFNGRFVDLFGPPREPETPFVLETNGKYDSKYVERCQHYADVAASIQAVLEDVLLRMVRSVHRETGLKKLCVAGGVALNGVVNGRILRESPFEDVFIQPAAGDSGGALGAALYVHHVVHQRPRQFVLEHAYWGQAYTNEEIRAVLEERGAAFQFFEDDEALLDQVIEALTAGQVVGWFQGRFEWGPRALGNRSIVADPRLPEMKDIVNHKVKFREPFRPFAPVVLEERASEFFEIPETAGRHLSRFMLVVVPVKEEMRDVLPAITHVGGTARIQTIRCDVNPRYYRLVEKFGEATEVPVLLNTSFNLRGEPIVNTPDNAYNTFSKSGIDLLVMEKFLVWPQGD